MNSIIYKWLNNSNDNNTLIECVLILSINGILIEYQSFIQYYNNVINNNNNNTLSPLSKQQFQILQNNINSLHQIYNNSINKTEITKIQTITINDDDDANNDNDNKIKFNCSIIIINKNNKINKLKNNYPNSNKTIGNTGVGDMNSLFFRVWRNIVTKNEILNHTRLYNIHYSSVVLINYNELSTYKYKDYLNKLNIRGQDDETIIKANSLPNNLTEIHIYTPIVIFEENSIPNSVTHLINYSRKIQLFTHGILSNTNITILDFNGSFNFNQKLSIEWLPKLLVTLKLGESFKHDIEQGQLPLSLTELKLDEQYNGIIKEGSIPLSVKNLHYKIDSNIKLTKLPIPCSITNLEFTDSFDQDIKQGDIPHNVTTLKIDNKFIGPEIDSKSFPPSLRILDMSDVGSPFTEPVKIPENLTSIRLRKFNGNLSDNLFPKSIVSIKLDTFSRVIPKGYFYNLINLTTLEIQNYNLPIPMDTLPISLTSLTLGIHYILPLNTLPCTLKSLTLLSENYKLEPNTLPPSLEILKVHSKNHFLPGVLPNTLIELYIYSIWKPHFDQDFTLDNTILPPLLQSIYIHKNCINYFNNLKSDFFLKYIKFINK